jgi:hypothetical protein
VISADARPTRAEVTRAVVKRILEWAEAGPEISLYLRTPLIDLDHGLEWEPVSTAEMMVEGFSNEIIRRLTHGKPNTSRWTLLLRKRELCKHSVIALAYMLEKGERTRIWAERNEQ